MFGKVSNGRNQEASPDYGGSESQKNSVDSSVDMIGSRLAKENAAQQREVMVIDDSSNSSGDVDVGSAIGPNSERLESASGSSSACALEDSRRNSGSFSSGQPRPPRPSGSYTNISVLLSRPTPFVNDVAATTAAVTGTDRTSNAACGIGPTPKFYRCRYCATEYNCSQLLDAHLQYYCLKRHANKETHCPVLKDLCDEEWQRGSGYDADSSGRACEVSRVLTSSSPVILLPCGYVDRGGVQIIGRPQTVVPVAVPRDASFAVSPLVVEDSCLRNVDIISDRIGINSSLSRTDKNPFFLPLVCGNTAFDQPVGSCPGSGKSRSADTLRVENGRTSCIRSMDCANSDCPAAVTAVVAASTAEGGGNGDGSGSSVTPDYRTTVASEKATTMPNEMVPTAVTMTRMPFMGNAETPEFRDVVGCSGMRLNEMVMLTRPLLINQASELSAARLPKNYTCENCGICFLSEKTLVGHQQYYCRTALNNNNRPSDPPESSDLSGMLSCQHCGYTGSSPSQLWRHVRYSHPSPHTFICILCGYKASSLRGVKSHLKIVHNTELKNIRDEPSAMHVLDNSDQGSRGTMAKAPGTVTAAPTAAEGGQKRFVTESSNSMEDSPAAKRRRGPDKEAPAPLLLCTMCEGKFADFPAFFTHTCSREPKTFRGHQNGAAFYASNMIEVQSSDDSFSLYECRFCRYRSAYKGNVKRHLTLVHRVDTMNDLPSSADILMPSKPAESFSTSANMSNLQSMQSVPNMSNVPIMQGVPGISNVPCMQQGVPSMSKIPSMQSVPTIPSVLSMQCTPSMSSIVSMSNVSNMPNVSNASCISTMPVVTSLPSVPASSTATTEIKSEPSDS